LFFGILNSLLVSLELAVAASALGLFFGGSGVAVSASLLGFFAFFPSPVLPAQLGY